MILIQVSLTPPPGGSVEPTKSTRLSNIIMSSNLGKMIMREREKNENKTEIDNYRDFIVSIKERTHNSNPTLTNTFSSGQVYQTVMK